jgi:2,6-dihydroxypseudooxynicotine hydrolase
VADATVTHVIETWEPRMIVQGIDYNDFVATSARIHTWDDWCREWCVTAAMHEEMAQQAEARGEMISAAEAYFLASMAYHFGCNNFTHDLDQYIPAHEKKVACYAKAAPYLEPPAERHEVPFDDLRMPAYLRRPSFDRLNGLHRRPRLRGTSGGERPPVVVIISGLESTKEEHRSFEDGLLRRGLATFSFDGPGQGETWFQGGMIVDFERATSAVIDYLEGLGEVDAGRLGVFGPSMGGYLGPRSAARDSRIKACAASGGSFDRSRIINRLDEPFEYARNAHIWKIYDKERLAEVLRQSTLEGVAQDISCPLLILHGTRDFVPMEQAERLYAAASGPKELVVIEDGNHVSNNKPYVYRPLVGDFMARVLNA